MGIQIRYGMVGGHMNAFIGEVHRKAIAFANIYKNIISAILAVKAGGTANDGSFDYPTVTDGLNGVKFIHAVIDSAAKDSAWVEL